MKAVLAGALILALVGCAKAPAAPADYIGLSTNEAARKLFEHGALKEGLWSISLKIEGVSINSLPSDDFGARAIINAISERVAMQPAREAKVCLSANNIGTVNIPGFTNNCRFKSLHLAEGTGASVMACEKSKLINAGTTTATYSFADGSFEQQAKLEAITDLGGAGKARPQVATMRAMLKYLGPCQATPAGKT